MRTFIAIELPKTIRDSLAQLEEQLKKSGADVKWVEPQNIHLTLKFLGEIDEQKLDKIAEITKNVASNRKTLYMRISSIGAFPKISTPRIIWVGINEGYSEIKEIAKELEERLVKLGIPKENRPFSSHITLGRTRSALNREKLIQELISAENILNTENLEFPVTKITLFRSTLNSSGPIYEVLKAADLKTI